MTQDTRFLPYGRQSVDDADVAAVAAVLRSDWLTTGPTVARFEAAFAEAVGAEHVVACSSGTAALHLALLAAGIGPGDSVIVPTVTFVATANAVRLVGAEVVFADVDPATGLMEPEHAAAALQRAEGTRVRAIMPVHMGGQAADQAGLVALAEAHGMIVIEDACHALGTTITAPTGRPVSIGACRHGGLATFSFHPVKAIAMGEGGAVTTGDAARAAHMRQLRNHGLTRDSAAYVNDALAFDGPEANPWYYEMPEVGFNYRASDINCALGLSQLGKLADFGARRCALAARYDAALAELAPLVRPVARTPGCEPVWHLYVVRIDFAAARLSRRQVMQGLHERGIGTQVHYIPVHHQPYYRARYGLQRLDGAEAYYRHCLSLPLFPTMADADVTRVVDALDAVLKDKPRKTNGPAARKRKDATASAPRHL